MKRIYISILFIILVLTGCDSPPEGLSEVKNVPDNIQEIVDPDLTLQIIADDDKGYYIIFYSSGEVAADTEIQDDTLLIKLTESNLKEGNLKQYTYYLSSNPSYDTIDVFVNEYSTAFDNITLQ